MECGFALLQLIDHQMPLSYRHFRRLLLLDEEAGPLEEELPR
ncbi:hypothetical protein E1528_23515, partial [Salmonella enterica subsp. enterica serovar Enteritidis]|nr:hypothetical protein [Salmonella enterica subsp. enterica serovar Enteritidis]